MIARVGFGRLGCSRPESKRFPAVRDLLQSEKRESMEREDRVWGTRLRDRWRGL